MSNARSFSVPSTTRTSISLPSTVSLATAVDSAASDIEVFLSGGDRAEQSSGSKKIGEA
jgi:hypothetical protein